jgi:glucose/arabinose dehydrogenase
MIAFVWSLSGFLSSGQAIPSLYGKAASPAAVWPNISMVPLMENLESPVHITHAGDNSQRLFVVEQPGRIRIYDGSLHQTPFLDITGRVLSPSSGGKNEEGLLSAAFPPGYGSGKDYFYVYYTNRDGNNQLSRFYLSQDADQADADSEELILLLLHPGFANHNGGQLSFGPEGYLYIGTGDGGGGGDPQGNSQNTDSLLGKILRIDVEPHVFTPQPGVLLYHLPLTFHNSEQTPGSQPYRIPPDNPFVDRPGYREEIWALGLRNPWRFSFDRETGDWYIGDVGQNAQEEVDYQPASSPGGENYGWPILEGEECYQAATCDETGLTRPVAVYHHDHAGAHQNCSVTGGYVYRGAAFAAMQGIYFYADYCSGIIWGLQHEGGAWIYQELLDTGAFISSFGESESGELFLTDHATGTVYQVLATP